MDEIEKRIAGWREWVALPDLGVKAIKAKLDTGARTSALHAYGITLFERNDEIWVNFAVHPFQRDDQTILSCRARVVDERNVTNSGGATEKRYFIETSILLDGVSWPIEIGLTNRDEMGFRMLLGRTAMKGRLTVDPSRSFRLGKRKRRRAPATGKTKP